MMGGFAAESKDYAAAYANLYVNDTGKAKFKQSFETMQLDAIAGNEADNSDLVILEELLAGMSGGGSGSEGGSVPGVEATQDLVVDGWLALSAQPTRSNGVLDTMHKNVSINNAAKWAMGEGSALKANQYMRALYSDTSASRPILEGNVAAYGSVNNDGRYWVAIGPAWFNRLALNNDGYFKSGVASTTASQWFSDRKGHEFDVVVLLDGVTYYIPCVMGDAKAHTAKDGHGYIQSGYGFDGTVYAQNRDFSIVEFVGVPGSTGAALNRTLVFVGILKY